MGTEIDVDDDVLDVLKTHAEPFVDTPNSVLRRLLGIDDPPSVVPAPRPPTPPRAASAPGSERKRRATGAKPPRTRAPNGSLLPESEYEMPLLGVLVEVGGSAPYREVEEAVGRALKEKLTEADLDNLASGGVRWKSRLQFVRLRLIERGLLDRDTPRGTWGITDAGRKAFDEGGQS